MANVVPGIRKPDGDANGVKRIGDYQLDSAQNLVCWPPKSETKIILDKTVFLQRIHRDNTITISGIIEVMNSMGVWRGNLRRGNWIEVASRNFAAPTTINVRRKLYINDTIDHFHDGRRTV